MAKIWDWDNPDCLRLFWEMFLGGESTYKMETRFKKSYQDAPSSSAIGSKLRSRDFREALEEKYGEDEVASAYRQFTRNSPGITEPRRFSFEVPEGAELPPLSRFALGRRPV